MDYKGVTGKIFRNKDLRLSKSLLQQGALPQFRCIFSHVAIGVCDGAHLAIVMEG